MKFQQLKCTFMGTLVGSYWLLLTPGISFAADCTDCHYDEGQTPGLYNEWKQSQHGQNGVTCLQCHQADPTDVDAFSHEGETISVIVSPKDCARCHETEVKEFDGSHHSRGGLYIPPEKNSLLGQTVGGHAAVVAGCEGCHGSKIELDAEKKPDMGWPNTGIGRINPDGSLGACTACHGRHSFSVAQARQPEACAKCHIGPDHPQLEVYNESMHGIIFRAKIDEMNLNAKPWRPGIEYSAAPTCATCHQSATSTLPATHDIGERLSWNLRAPISNKKSLVRLDSGHQYDVHGEAPSLPEVGQTVDDPHSKTDPKTQAKVTEVLTWQKRRELMQTVCKECHTSGVVNGHYRTLDNLVVLYNDKFAKPVKGVMDELASSGLTTPTPFDDWIEWLWWEIWHHEGRRARSGAAMGGPDYAWWHGIYDVAKRTYMEFIPELAEVAGYAESDRLLTQHFKSLDDHSWFFNAVRPSLEEIVVVDLTTLQSQQLVKRVRFQPTVTKTDSGLEISGPLTVLDMKPLSLVDKKLIGQTVKMAVVVVSSDQYYMMSGNNGQLSAWDKNLKTLNTFSQEITLAPTQKVNILTGQMSRDGQPLTGDVEVYVGFRVGNILVYFLHPLDVSL